MMATTARIKYGNVTYLNVVLTLEMKRCMWMHRCKVLRIKIKVMRNDFVLSVWLFLKFFVSSQRLYNIIFTQIHKGTNKFILDHDVSECKARNWKLWEVTAPLYSTRLTWISVKVHFAKLCEWVQSFLTVFSCYAFLLLCWTDDALWKTRISSSGTWHQLMNFWRAFTDAGFWETRILFSGLAQRQILHLHYSFTIILQNLTRTEIQELKCFQS